MCRIGLGPGPRWLHTCRGPASWPILGLGEPTTILEVRAKILLLLAVGAARLQSHCECRDEGWAASAYAKLEQAAAVRMVARGCACGRTVGRCRARGARMQPSTIASSLKSTGTEDARNAHFGPVAGEKKSSFGKTAAWGRLVGRQRVNVRSQSRKKRSF